MIDASVSGGLVMHAIVASLAWVSWIMWMYVRRPTSEMGTVAAATTVMPLLLGAVGTSYGLSQLVDSGASEPMDAATGHAILLEALAANAVPLLFGSVGSLPAVLVLGIVVLVTTRKKPADECHR